MSDVPLIGCRISIISKAKIRYEGYLHSVDCDTLNEPVITLSKVWSFGTEDRPCERPVAPRNEEYNQVVFRGRDLEDVRLVQSSVFLNEDSAIVSAAPGSASSALHKDDKNIVGLPPSSRTPSTLPSSPRTSLASASHSVALEILNQNTPKSGAFVQPSTTNTRLGPVGTLQSDRASQLDTRGPRPFGDGRSDGDLGFSGVNKPYLSRIVPGTTTDDLSKQRLVLGSSSRFDSMQTWGNNDAQTRNVPRDDSSTYPSKNNGPTSDQFHSRRHGYTNQWPGNHRGYRIPADRYSRRNLRSGFHGWSRSRANAPAASQPNFTGEYDYEKANAELAAELDKISISVSKPCSLDSDTGKGDESNGSVTGDDAVCYDKTRSFFDTLSSEMMDKANGVLPQGMNRRDERLLNSTTFGTTTSHLTRRGGYHNRSGGGYGNHRSGNNGRFWRPVGNNAPRNAYNTGPLSSTSRVK